MWCTARVGSPGSGPPVQGQRSCCHTTDSTWVERLTEEDNASHRVKKTLMFPLLPGGCSPSTKTEACWGTRVVLGTQLQGQSARWPKTCEAQGLRAQFG